MIKRTTIAISEDVRDDIFKMGKMGDTPNKIIRRLIDYYHKSKESTKPIIQSKQVKQSKQDKQPKQTKQPKQSKQHKK